MLSIVVQISIKESPAYFSSQVAKAYLYLDHRQDKETYLNCLQDLAQRRNSLNSYMILGDAFMKIQLPELALEAYQNVFYLNSKNEILIEQIGKGKSKYHLVTIIFVTH